MFTLQMLKCADSSDYTGMTSNLEFRLAQHQNGTYADGYTASRRPVQLVGPEIFATHDGAFRRERQIKGWSHAKRKCSFRGIGWPFSGSSRVNTTGDNKKQAELVEA